MSDMAIPPTTPRTQPALTRAPRASKPAATLPNDRYTSQKPPKLPKSVTTAQPLSTNEVLSRAGACTALILAGFATMQTGLAIQAGMLTSAGVSSLGTPLLAIGAGIVVACAIPLGLIGTGIWLAARLWHAKK